MSATISAINQHCAIGNSTPFRVGALMPQDSFERIRRKMLLDHCKWDAQIGDITTLARFPLLISSETWQTLARLAENLTAEIYQAENEILTKPHLLASLSLPRAIRQRLEYAHESGLTPAAARSMRFDFHFTPDGWQISEVNSDVPGGFTESSSFTSMMAGYYTDATPAGDPIESWAGAIVETTSTNGTIGLISAPGYMEDHQIIAYLAANLRRRGCLTYLASPSNVRWQTGRAQLETGSKIISLDGLVRFYQAEWLTTLPQSEDWLNFFTGGTTPVANPGVAAIAESKRFPLLWDLLRAPMKTWRQLLPESCEPATVPWQTDDRWLVKTALSNTGDTVSIREHLSAEKWTHVVRDVGRHPQNWIAQRRFEIIPLQTPLGPLHPCLGVYTINGKAAGIYGRISPNPVINFQAIDVAVLVLNQSTSSPAGEAMEAYG